MAKVRVYELAKEFGVESKAVMAKLQELGEFVRSASSTIEAPVVRKLTDAFQAQGQRRQPQARPRPQGCPGKPGGALPGAGAVRLPRGPGPAPEADRRRGAPRRAAAPRHSAPPGAAPGPKPGRRRSPRRPPRPRPRPSSRHPRRLPAATPPPRLRVRAHARPGSVASRRRVRGSRSRTVGRVRTAARASVPAAVSVPAPRVRRPGRPRRRCPSGRSSSGQQPLHLRWLHRHGAPEGAPSGARRVPVARAAPVAPRVRGSRPAPRPQGARWLPRPQGGPGGARPTRAACPVRRRSASRRRPRR